QGYNTLWIPGTDHAGIATQNVVEREIAKEGKNRHQLGRTTFEERVWQWRETYGDRILHQLRRLGASCDWSREAFTLDANLTRASIASSEPAPSRSRLRTTSTTLPSAASMVCPKSR